MAVLKYYNTTTSAWEYIAASTTANFTSWKKTAAGGETSVSGTDDNAVTLSYTVGLEQVFINGVLQVRGSDYTATNGTSVTGLTALVAGDIVTVVCYAPFNVANTIAPTVVDAKGDLIAGTAADTVGRLAVGANDFVLTAASGETTGLKWDFPSKILQVVRATDATARTTTSTSSVDASISVTITPKKSTSAVLLIWSFRGTHYTTSDFALFSITDSSNNNISGAEFGVLGSNTTSRVDSSITLIGYATPGTTSATTYKGRFRVETNGTAELRNNLQTGQLFAIEVAA
jgi:hypothetical protein